MQHYKTRDRQDLEQDKSEYNKTALEFFCAALAPAVIILCLLASLGLLPDRTERLMLLGIGAVMNIGVGILGILSERTLVTGAALFGFLLTVVCMAFLLI